MTKHTIDTLLIANRGEIACRIIRTAKRMGIKTVAVHSEIDKNAQHVQQADISYNLGGSKPNESYLLGDKIIQAAKATGAQAIHPGYGFLSENDSFAQAVEQAGLIFVGPPSSAITSMGSKSAAKNLMQEAGVPLVPGFHGKEQDYETFKKAADEIGYPVLLKASAGGGGKGMKVVEQESDLQSALDSAQREAQSSFGNPHMLIEKYVLKPRHVEIQIFADQHGHCVYLNERDCSIQRRHQKVVEEAPAPGLTPELRQAMGEAAVKAAQAIGYVNAGTVEFLLDERGHFFFMEMNTRLQVEHPVTELITQQDLVEWQINVARGEKLPLSQEEVPLIGHAIEVRLYAEDPDNDFLPATGVLSLYQEPKADESTRTDSGIKQGDEISPFYDPMISKVIAWGEDREAARLKLINLLSDTHIAGVKTNLAFLKRILSHQGFAKADLDTDFIVRYENDLFIKNDELSDEFWMLAAKAWVLSQHNVPREDDLHSPWGTLHGWRNALAKNFTLSLDCEGQQRTINLDAKDLENTHWSNNRLTITKDAIASSHFATRKNNQLYFRWQDILYTLTITNLIDQIQEDSQIQGGLTAPMNGSIVKVLISTNQQVKKGDTLVVLEAMKMEHSINAPHDGIVKEIFCQEGELVNDGTLLVELEGEEQ